MVEETRPKDDGLKSSRKAVFERSFQLNLTFTISRTNGNLIVMAHVAGGFIVVVCGAHAMHIISVNQYPDALSMEEPGYRGVEEASIDKPGRRSI